MDSHLRALAGFSRRLRQINASSLPANEQIDHRIVMADVEARTLELDTVRSWERNPRVYAEILSTSLAGQTLFSYASDRDRARRVLSKLRQVPRFVDAARSNVSEPAGIFVKAALPPWRGVVALIEKDLPRVFAALDDLHLLGDLADASTEAVDAVQRYLQHLEQDVAPKAKASFRLGAAAFAQKLKLDEGVTIDADKLMAIALRALGEVQEQFRVTAGRLKPGDVAAVWEEARAESPAPGSLVATSTEQLSEIMTFLNRHSLVSMPADDPVIVAPSPSGHRWLDAHLWSAGPFESHPGRAHYYLTDVDPAWPAEQQQEHLAAFDLAGLSSRTLRETYPGRYLQSRRLPTIDSNVRKSKFFASATCVDGWAHYCEQMVLDAGFRKRDTAARLGQLASGLVRLARCVVAIRLHCEDLSVEQGMRFFRDEAFLAAPAARREAERGAVEPMYLTGALGKQMLLKLRHDAEEDLGDRFSPRSFHDTFLGNGAVPFWAHRALMLPDDSDQILD